MLQGWVVIAIALAYIGFLFLVASVGDKLRPAGGARWRQLIYPLSLAVYCTSWTFFGSVGLSSHTGLDFLTIYIGPILMIGLAWPLVARIVRLAKANNITSIADFIAARHGKNQAVAALVTIIAVVGTVPYIALQLKAVSASLGVILDHLDVDIPAASSWLGDLSLFVALSMAAFAILFGTRHTDATEHQAGLMLAVATESAVKLVAFLAVGGFVVFAVYSGPFDLLATAVERPEVLAPYRQEELSTQWLTMTLLSLFAILLLPRQFHVTVVENNGPEEIRRAAWLFPLYLVLINLFVVPVAIAGSLAFPNGRVDSDMFVLALPLAAGSEFFAMLAFVGGLSAATAMVIVESVAVSIMVSNGLVMPLVLRYRLAGAHGVGEERPGDMTALLLATRRLAILAILLFAYLYYRTAGAAQLAQIGLLAFAAAAQFAPAFFIGLLWRGGNARGAIAGLVAGVAAWGYTLLLPSFVSSGLVEATILTEGPFGIELLRPQSLLGVNTDPLSNGVLWSLLLNTLCYVAFSRTRAAQPIEQLQATIFVEREPMPMRQTFRLRRTSVTVGELIETVARYLGAERTRRSFESFAEAHQVPLQLSREADFRLLRYAEHLLSSAIGAASSRLVLSLLLRKPTVSTQDALKLLDDASAAIHYNREILQIALDNVRQGIAVFDRDLRLMCWNRRFGDMLELPPDLLRIGTGIDDVVRAMAARGTLGEGELEAVVADRVERYAGRLETVQERLPLSGLVVEVGASRMPDGGLVLTFTDITASVAAAETLERANETLERRVRERTLELMRLNEELERAKGVAEDANISKTRFLAAASHDILQPLNAARLYTTSLVERTGDPDEGRLARNIDASLEAVEEILGALLDISRLDAGALRAEVGTFRLSELFTQLQTEFRLLAAEKGLDIDFVPSSLVVRSDRRLLRRMIQNLVSNAVKYTPRGRVLVGVRRKAGRARIEVHDTGIGIPSAQQNLIFKEFQRLEQGARVARGLGLGLSIVERLGRVLDHRITLVSTPGRGSVFAVEVPTLATVVVPAAPVPSVEPPPISAPLAGLSVLAIDNEPRILDGMEALLSGWGCRVLTARSLDDALRVVRDAPPGPDVLLVDYHLDEGHGLDAIVQLRWRLGDLPAVLITADRSPAVRDAARAKEVQVLHKPVNPAALRALLAQWRVAKHAAE